MARSAPAALARIAPFACLLLAAAAPPARAAWPHDPDTNLPVSTFAADQFEPRATSDGAGGVIIVWHDFRNGGQYDLYAQRISAAGVPLWTADGIPICTAGNNQAYPTIVPDGSGGALIAWQDWRNFNWDVYAQRVNAAGVVQWAPNGVAVCADGSDQNAPVVASDGAGGAIVAWHDVRSGISWDVYARRVNAAGTALWTANGVGLCTVAGHQQNPTITSDGVGGAIVAWGDYRAGNGDVYGQRVNSLGLPQWTANGVVICSSTNGQDLPLMVPDGAGGGIVAFRDDRSSVGVYDIYAARVSPTGTALWPASGIAVCTANNEQTRYSITPDGAGGAVVAWDDVRNSSNWDVYAQRLAPGGTVSWTPNGVAVCLATSDQQSPTVVSDGAGGAIVAWNDARSSISYDIFAQRVSVGGVAQWTANGIAVCTAAQGQHLPAAVADASGGAIVTWHDYRGGGPTDIYAQRIDRFGYLGNPEPAIASVRDVPNDQGGKVKVSWYASWLDGVSDPNLAAYDVYRSAPGSLAELALNAGAHRLAGFGEPPPAAGRSFVITGDAPASVVHGPSPTRANLYAWELVGTVAPTHFLSAYGFVASTTGDSVGGSNPRSVFMVVGRNSSGSMYWLSPPDSGYSVDNIPPAAPAPFAAAYSAGATHLHWGVNSEGDLAGYRLYRGSSSGFVPGPGNLISAQPDTGFGDSGPAGSWYKLAAVDSHGNESVFAVLGPGGTTDVAPFGGSALSLAAPAPNPVRGEGATFRIALPAEARVWLSLYDQQGRRVRDVLRATLSGGEHLARWDGRDAAGNTVPSGIYFARLDAMERTMRVTFVVVR